MQARQESDGIIAIPHSYLYFFSEAVVTGSSGEDTIMASLLPLLHDLLPMIIPSEPHVIRATEPACVEELAEAPPWYQISSAADGAPQTGDTDNCQESTLHSETDAGHFEPIRLRDHEETHAEAHLPNSTRQQSSLGSVKSSQQISEPRVFRQDMMAGITDKMGATGKLEPNSRRLASRIKSYTSQIPLPNSVAHLFVLAYTTFYDFSAQSIRI